MTPCRLLVDEPATGDWNMAVDEWLLAEAARSGVPALRFYAWREPTLSLGYFQAHAERRRHRASLTCPLVRRASGGGAILHDRELTYSIALPVSHPAAARATTLYDALHESLIAALADRGIAASLCAPAARLSPADEPFLCFQRRSPGDVLCGQFKIAGSAQRRRGGAIVQHGSVLLSLSEFAPELPGLAELSEKSLERGTLSNLWGAGIAEILGFELVRRPLDTSEKSAVDACACRYSDDAWTRRR